MKLSDVRAAGVPVPPAPACRIHKRFWSKVRPRPGGCWEWQGALGGDGYDGRFRIGNRLVSPRRFVYETTRGPVPAGLWVSSLCCNPHCVNPTHLAAMTRSEVLRAYRSNDHDSKTE